MFDTIRTMASSTSLTHEERIAIVRRHYEGKGYRVHSGLQFGCELVLYSDSPGRVHSDFCVHVPPDRVGTMDWRTLQTLVRSMPDLHKTLIVAHVRVEEMSAPAEGEEGGTSGPPSGDGGNTASTSTRYCVDELCLTSEHAPFRQKNAPTEVGKQVKPQRNQH